MVLLLLSFIATHINYINPAVIPICKRQFIRVINISVCNGVNVYVVNIFVIGRFCFSVCVQRLIKNELKKKKKEEKIVWRLC